MTDCFYIYHKVDEAYLRSSYTFTPHWGNVEGSHHTRVATRKLLEQFDKVNDDIIIVGSQDNMDGITIPDFTDVMMINAFLLWCFALDNTR